MGCDKGRWLDFGGIDGLEKKKKIELELGRVIAGAEWNRRVGNLLIAVSIWLD